MPAFLELAASGRVFIAGDLHGCYTQLQAILTHIAFNPAEGDCCILVGDLTDRGPDSIACLQLIEKPGFISVQGNHETMLLAAWQHTPLSEYCWCQNGGTWFYRLPADMQHHLKNTYTERISELPYAIEITTIDGLHIGICHADPVFPDWHQLRQALQTHEIIPTPLIEKLVWSRERLTLLQHTSTPPQVAQISHIDYCVMGHTPLRNTPVQHGNCIWIDGGAAFAGGTLTVMEATQPPRFYITRRPESRFDSALRLALPVHWHVNTDTNPARTPCQAHSVQSHNNSVPSAHS